MDLMLIAGTAIEENERKIDRQDVCKTARPSDAVGADRAATIGDTEELRRTSFASSRTGGGGDACLVCMERPPDAVLLECGHGGVCVACAEVLWRQGRRCPLCRARFCGVVRILRGESDTVRGSRASLASRDSFAAICSPRAPPLLPAVGKEGRGGRTSELQEGGSQRCTETPGSEDGDVTARVGGVAACRQEGMPPKLT